MPSAVSLSSRRAPARLGLTEGTFHFHELFVSISGSASVPAIIPQRLVIPSDGVKLNAMVTVLTDEEFNELRSEMENVLKDSKAKIDELQQKLDEANARLDDWQTPGGQLRIIKGRYWIEHPKTGEVLEEDVTEKLGDLVLDEKLALHELDQVIFPDPLKGVKKKLTIDYSHGGRYFSVTVPESTKITLPFPYQDIPFPKRQ